MTTRRSEAFPENKIRFQLLDMAKDEEEYLLTDLEEDLADRIQIQPSVRLEKKPGRTDTKFLDRVRWCRTHLKIAGLISNPQRGYYKITKEGLKFLEKCSTDTITQADLSNIESFAKWAHDNEEAKKRGRESRSKPLKRGLVIMIDALGTKAHYRSGNSDTKKWRDFVENLKQKIKESSCAEVHPYIVSDTIIIAINTLDIRSMLLRISPTLEWAIIESMKAGRPIRGCIAEGKIYTDNVQVVGEPVVEAAEYYEQAQWVGISACPSVHKVIENMPEEDRYPHFQKFDLPLRNSIELDAWVVNWVYLTEPDDGTRAILENPGTLDLSAALKWRNTKRFFTRVMSE